MASTWLLGVGLWCLQFWGSFHQNSRMRWNVSVWTFNIAQKWKTKYKLRGKNKDVERIYKCKVFVRLCINVCIILQYKYMRTKHGLVATDKTSNSNLAELTKKCECSCSDIKINLPWVSPSYKTSTRPVFSAPEKRRLLIFDIYCSKRQHDAFKSWEVFLNRMIWVKYTLYLISGKCKYLL